MQAEGAYFADEQQTDLLRKLLFNDRGRHQHRNSWQTSANPGRNGRLQPSSIRADHCHPVE